MIGNKRTWEDWRWTNSSQNIGGKTGVYIPLGVYLDRYTVFKKEFRRPYLLYILSKTDLPVIGLCVHAYSPFPPPFSNSYFFSYLSKDKFTSFNGSIASRVPDKGAFGNICFRKVFSSG